MCGDMRDARVSWDKASHVREQLDFVKRDIAALEFMLHVSIIFIENFMNKNENLTKTSINTKKEILRQSLQYFSSWHQYIALKVGGMKANEKKFISSITYNNLRMMVCGFFAYADLLLHAVNNPPAFVPFLHSNQSTIEASFSVC